MRIASIIEEQPDFFGHNYHELHQ